MMSETPGVMWNTAILLANAFEVTTKAVRNDPMSYRTVLFAIDEDSCAEPHIDYAAQLARSFDARLVGLGCHRPTPWPSAGAVACIAGDPLTIELREAEEAAVAREGIFLQRCRLAGLPASQAILENFELASAVCRHALFADLVVMTQPRLTDIHHPERLRRAHVILQESVRPVLMLAQAGGFAPLPGTVVVAWDGSASAARAAASALPLMRRARNVHLVQVIDPRKDDEGAVRPGLECASTWLSGHGIEARIGIVEGDHPARSLLSKTADVGAELLVMGAWGHGRLVERLLGGATRAMVDGMAVPVMFAH